MVTSTQLYVDRIYATPGIHPPVTMVIALRSDTGDNYQHIDIRGGEWTFERSKEQKEEKRRKKEQTKWALQEYGRIMRLRFENIERKERWGVTERLKAVQ